MSEAFMAYPKLRHPFEPRSIHEDGNATVLYQGKQITLTNIGDGERLLIDPADLTRINGFEVKAEGACYEDACIPITSDLLVQQGDRTWLDLCAFADLIEQPYVADTQARVWSFADIPARRENLMVSAQAPDFEVKDRQGNVIRMADFKGKKALIVTWSSW